MVKNKQFYSHKNNYHTVFIAKKWLPLTKQSISFCIDSLKHMYITFYKFIDYND